MFPFFFFYMDIKSTSSLDALRTERSQALTKPSQTLTKRDALKAPQLQVPAKDPSGGDSNRRREMIGQSRQPNPQQASNIHGLPTLTIYHNTIP